MIVKETKCKKDILKVLNNEDIYSRMVSDDLQGECPSICFKSKRYICGYVDSEVIGVCIYRKIKEGNIIHFYVLPEYRKKYAKNFAKESLKMKGKGDVFAITPLCYMPVINFALKLGFEYTGNHNKFFIKNGVAYEQAVTRLRA